MPDALHTRFLAKLRYYRQGFSWPGMVGRVLLETLGKAGIIISPTYLVLEGLGGKSLPHLEQKFADDEFGFLDAPDMKPLAAMPERHFSEEELLRRLAEGQKCFGVKRNGQIVAFTWCSMAPYAFADRQAFPLQQNEAYLFDAYTVSHVRGSGIAPVLRYRCYQELAKLGRDRCYSLTAFSNTPAMNFKKKLGAQILELRLYVELWGRWWWSIQLRDYRGKEAPANR